MSAHRAPLPPVEQRASEQILRAASALDDPFWHETAAMVVCASGEVREGLAALPLLAELRARHTAVPMGPGSSTMVCPTCHIGEPCDEAVLLGLA